MDITLVTGGARSGKSSFVEARALALGGSRVSYVATAAASDDDLTERIARHRSRRPTGWETIESADAASAIANARHEIVILDCVTMLAARAISGPAARDRATVDAAIEAAIAALLAAAAERAGALLVVTNEVGMSIHPPTAVGLWFQDAMGRANQRLAAAAREVVLMVSGIPVCIKPERG